MLAAAAPALAVAVAAAIPITRIAVAAAGASSARLLSHELRHLFICRGAALVYGQTEVLVHRAEQCVELLPSLQKALAERVVHHILTQLVELGNLLLAGGHTGQVLIAQLLAIFIHPAEKIRSLGVLIKKTNASLGRHDLLALRKCTRKCRGKRSQLRSK